MQKDAEKLRSDTCPVLDALMRYVNDHVPWACLPFPSGGQGCAYVIFKPHPKSIVKHVYTMIAKKAKTPPNKWDKLLNPDEEMTVGMMVDMFKKMGTEFPMCSIGVVDGESRSATGFVVHYNGSVVLDYSDPAFFDHLDRVLAHITTHDGLSGFSLLHQSGASSDPHYAV